MTLETVFSVRHKHFVTVYHEEFGEVGQGTLLFGKGEWAHLNFRLSSPSKLEDGETYPRLVAKAASGEVFTLFGCAFHVFYAAIDFIVEGEMSAEFPRICVRYSEASEWFLGRQRLDGEVGETLTWVNKPEPIAVNVRTDTEHFALSTSVVGNHTHSGEDHSISEHVIFTFERLGGLFGVDDVPRHCRQLSNFLSVLIAQPVNIISVGLADDATGFHYAYFPHFKMKSKKGGDGTWLRWLIQRDRLDGRWESVLERYYRSEFREVAWARLAGMQRYKGFWEFRTFGYVSMLDGFVQKKSYDQKVGISPPSEKRMKKFRNKLAQLPGSLTEEQRADIVGLARESFSKKEEKSFAWCYNYACSTSDEAVVSVINISDNDFSIIKTARDAIAHGGDYNLSIYPIELLFKLVSKITLLLTYWAYVDFGLTAKDFLRCLYETHNRLVQGSEIDKASLDRFLDTAPFYRASEQRFDEIASSKGDRIHVCLVRDESGEVRLSEKYAKRVEDWKTSRKTGFIGHAELLGVEASQVTYSGTAYVEDGKRTHRLTSVYLIDETKSVPE